MPKEIVHLPPLLGESPSLIGFIFVRGEAEEEEEEEKKRERGSERAEGRGGKEGERGFSSLSYSLYDHLHLFLFSVLPPLLPRLVICVPHQCGTETNL